MLQIDFGKTGNIRIEVIIVIYSVHVFVEKVRNLCEFFLEWVNVGFINILLKTMVIIGVSHTNMLQRVFRWD
jgi:hypothetical protein